MIKTEKKLYKSIILLILSFVLVVSVSIIRYPQGDINFTNSDATYHTLLTMQAYDETPASVHKFLPIVTLGNEADKHIEWGATIPDKYGNYYYTSFSPFGYVLPYLFCKIFAFPISITSLYVFNSILYFISTLLIGLIIYQLFESSQYRMQLSIVALFVYALIPEVLFSMGIVYWHQSIMQVLLLLQLYIFIYMLRQNPIESKKSLIVLFCLLCLVNPYVEWTGYVANVGYAIAFILIYRKNIIKWIKWCLSIGLITILSFCLFSLHYLSVVDKKDYFITLYSRFLVRRASGIKTAEELVRELIEGYFTSFISCFVVILLLIIILLFVYKGFGFIKNSIILQNKIICFVALFPVFENLIMKEHALSYTYDRMKLSVFWVIIVSDLLQMLFLKIEADKIMKRTLGITLSMVSVISIISCSWVKDNRVWSISYGDSNIKLANYVTEKYTRDNSIYGLNNLPVRGYINLIFERSIYENKDLEYISNIAVEKNYRYAVEIIADAQPWNMYELKECIIYDSELQKYTKVFLSDGEICEKLLTQDEVMKLNQN